MTPDFTQSASGLEPPTVLDHVLMPVADLGDGARRLYDRFGLQGIPGGRHPKVGTANFIVPLGRQYLELIAIVDPQEAARSRLGRRVARALKEGRTFVGWALRTQDLDAVRAKLQGAGWDVPALVDGSRKRPDGQVLRWRTQDVEGDSDPTALVRDQLELLLGQSRLYDVRQSDADGVEELALENEDGALVIT